MKIQNSGYLCIISLMACMDSKGTTTIDLDDTEQQENIEDSAEEETLEPTQDPEPTQEPEPGSNPNSTDNDGDGYSEDNGDCDDTDPNSSPNGTDEDVDGIDQNCDGVDGIDADGDGVASTESGGDDCDDSNDNISPELTESCDYLDNDCDGVLNNDRDCLVYAHSPSTLYEVDPFQRTLSEITSVPSLYDFDTDLSGTLYGISPPSTVYIFDESTLSWNTVASVNHNGGTLNGFCIHSSNQIYATVGNQVYTIDTNQGSATLLGNLGGNFHSSGDCVVDKIDGIYMTSTGSPGDNFVRINPETGEGTLVGNTGISGIYGLTSAWGYMFGFTGNGSLVEIDKTTGSAQVLHTFPNIVFYGAASSAMR